MNTTITTIASITCDNHSEILLKSGFALIWTVQLASYKKYNSFFY